MLESGGSATWLFNIAAGDVLTSSEDGDSGALTSSEDGDCRHELDLSDAGLRVHGFYEWVLDFDLSDYTSVLLELFIESDITEVIHAPNIPDIKFRENIRHLHLEARQDICFAVRALRDPAVSFHFLGLGRDGFEPSWWFLDNFATEFGPFPASTMREWFMQGFFPIGAELPVRVDHWKFFAPVGACFPNIMKAFDGPPAIEEPKDASVFGLIAGDVISVLRARENGDFDELFTLFGEEAVREAALATSAALIREGASGARVPAKRFAARSRRARERSSP